MLPCNLNAVAILVAILPSLLEHVMLVIQVFSEVCGVQCRDMATILHTQPLTTAASFFAIGVLHSSPPFCHTVLLEFFRRKLPHSLACARMCLCMRLCMYPQRKPFTRCSVHYSCHNKSGYWLWQIQYYYRSETWNLWMGGSTRIPSNFSIFFCPRTEFYYYVTIIFRSLCPY